MRLSQDAKDSIRLWSWGLGIAGVIVVSLWLTRLFGASGWVATFLNSPLVLAVKVGLLGWLVWRVFNDVRARHAARRRKDEVS